MSYRILIMAGGTGGHVFPGLALADALAAKGWDVHWLGTENRMEAKLVPDAGYPINFIDVVGVRGNGVIRKLMAPWRILKSIAQAKGVLKAFQPHIVVGMGGFAAGPGGIAAWTSAIPLLIHEQNAIAGMTNRILANFSSKVLMGFEHAFGKGQNRTKFIHVGNPIRRELIDLAVSTVEPKESTNVLIVGGSLGAKALNENVPIALAQQVNVCIKHQTGKGHLDSVERAYQQVNLTNVDVSEFIDDMAQAYQWADIVICRAGALTVAEVAAMGKVAIFIPLPHAVDDHQTKNAMSLVNSEAGYILSQSKLENGELTPLLKQILSAPSELEIMSQKARKLAKLDATEQLVVHCQTLVGDV